MRDGLRYVFFSLVFAVLLAGIFFLALTDTISNLFKTTSQPQIPVSSSNSGDNDHRKVKLPNVSSDSEIDINNNHDFDSQNADNESNAEKNINDSDDKTSENLYSSADWKKYKEIREKYANLSSKFDGLIDNILNNRLPRSEKYIFNALDKNSLDKFHTYGFEIADAQKDRERIIAETMNNFNRDIVSSALEMLASEDESIRRIALEYFSSNVFPELGDIIVSQIIDTISFEDWSDSALISKIFTYYVNAKNIPKFLKVYVDYADVKASKGKERFSNLFNSFFAGISSHVPFDKKLAELSPKYWIDFYKIYPEKIVGLLKNDKNEIITPEPTGSMPDFHKELSTQIQKLGNFYNWYNLKIKVYRSADPNNSVIQYPQHLTFVPIVFEIIKQPLIEKKRREISKQEDAFKFLTDACQSIYAEEMCRNGISKIAFSSIRKSCCRYFSRIGNYEGYGLKYAFKYLKGKYEIDEDCRNMIIALDEPELIVYLMEYNKVNDYWATVMVRLTRHTFGSIKEDCKRSNWLAYLIETLPKE